MSSIDKLNFLTKEQVRAVAEKFGTPVFVYDEKTLRSQARAALAFPAPYGLTVRYAMKANPNRHILSLFQEEGIKIDASSGYEVERAIKAGIEPADILLTSQELPKNLKDLVQKGVHFNACSLHQLEVYGKLFPDSEVSVRINPGIGSGHSTKTNVGGPSSSFGIWHEYIDKILDTAQRHKLTITRLHTHIGTGANPAIWTRAARLSLQALERFPDVKTLNLGGGFKIARMHDEIATDLQKVGQAIAQELRRFQEQTGRKLHLEIEPGTFLVGNAATLVSKIQDIVDTGSDGHEFLKLDSGMTEILRQSLYGSQHPMIVVNDRPEQHKKYVVVGHCCESGDLLTPYPAEPDAVDERALQQAEIGDFLVMEGVGAYCAHMSAQNYNSFPVCSEVMLKKDGSFTEIRHRQSLEAVLQSESV